MFEKGGYCRISLLARRAPEHPDQVEVSGTGEPQRLVALQDNWYQDFVPAEAGHLLRSGVEWLAALPRSQRVRWSLAGREIYVFGPHDELTGFVNTTRLLMGEQHVVLCTTERHREVSEAIAKAGSEVPDALSGKGLPEGWLALRGIVPTRAVTASATGDILDTLRPVAEVDIALEGGIRLERQSWLEGFPPRIRLRGDVGSAGIVRIDGAEASLDLSGRYVSPGWDAPGEHVVSCSSGSRSYSVRAGAEEWEAWDAYAWPQESTRSATSLPRPTICGAFVRPPAAAAPHSRPIVVPASNSLLIGSGAGEIAYCTSRTDLGATTCIGFPAFEPVWAVPPDAFRADKRSVRVLMIGQGLPPRADGSLGTKIQAHTARRVEAWRNAILNASRKGLSTEPGRSDAEQLWRTYQLAAKSLRRRR